MQTRSINKYTKTFRSIVLELNDRAPAEDALVFDYNARLLSQVLLQRPNLPSKAKQLAKRADMVLLIRWQQRRQSLQQPKQQW